jgi:hypothetical protein
MKILIFVVLISLMAMGQKCGVERWAVKTMTDSDAGKVNTRSIVDTTVKTLSSFKAPLKKDWTAAKRKRFPEELKVYRVKASLVCYKLESDSDFHIVIADLDDSKVTMIVEIPSPACMKDSRILPLRESLETKYGMAGKGCRLVPGGVVVTVTGVGFFDFKHGQTGVADNGFELHPVTGIVLPQ